MHARQIRVTANGIGQNVLAGGALDGPPVLLVHGNCSSSAFWAPLLRHLPDTLRIVAPDLRGYGDTEAAPVDATRGLDEFADDVAALLDVPELFPAGTRPVVVAHSMGGGVAMSLAAHHPARIAALMLESPLSPYGFGGTHGPDGMPNTPDFAGTGGGTVNAEFVRLLAAKDRGLDTQTTPRAVMRGTYVADPASFGADEELLLDSMLSTVVGTDNYPGDAAPSTNWPLTAPGTRGVVNAMSPRWLRLDEALVGMEPKPPVLWVRGAADVIVSDTSLLDLAHLGALGLVPGWPGQDACPPQPMVTQTRAVLERYAATGGSYTEIVYEGCGHSPHVERAAQFARALLDLVDSMR